MSVKRPGAAGAVAVCRVVRVSTTVPSPSNSNCRRTGTKRSSSHHTSGGGCTLIPGASSGCRRQLDPQQLHAPAPAESATSSRSLTATRSVTTVL